MTWVAFLAVAVGLAVLARRRLRERVRVRRRLERYARADAYLAVVAVRRRPGLEAWRRLRDTVEARLQMGRIPLRANEYLGILAAAAATGLLVGFAVRGAGGALVLGGFCAAGVWLWPARAVERRRRQFTEQLPGALAAMAGALRAGQSLQHAISVVAREYPDPAGPEFERVVRSMQLGMRPADAVRQMRERTGAEEVAYLESALALHQQTGSDLGYLLDRIVETLRTRMEAEAELRALTAQARLSGRVLLWMPFVLAGALYLIDRDYGRTMFGTVPGRIVVAVSAALLLLGRSMIRRIAEVF